MSPTAGGRGAHYLLTVERNQPTLHRQLRDLPWAQVPVADRTHRKGHGRLESRTVKLLDLRTGIGFPHARLAIQITCRRRPPTGTNWRTETVYAVTDMTWEDTRADQIADAIRRGHWAIENRLHWLVDRTHGVSCADLPGGGVEASSWDVIRMEARWDGMRCQTDAGWVV